MRERIICRFEKEEDLAKLNARLGLNLTKDHTYYNFTNGEEKIKNPSKPKVEKHYEWEDHWINMPEHISKNQEVYAKIEFAFGDNLEFAKDILEQNITDKTTSVWYPKLIPGKHSKHRAVGGSKNMSQYPIFVVSKGRPTQCYTSMFLSRMEQIHFVVVEPNEVEEYKKNLECEYCKIIPLDMGYKEKYDTFDNLGLTKSPGPGPARNFCWDLSIQWGFKWHWVMDDNANEGFHLMNRNRKIKCKTSAIFKASEDFVNRYDNIAIAGLNYSKFCMENTKSPAYVLNTRIYSFLLIRNDIPYRWRGRYNEDTDLSLRVLKDGWCTVQFNTFLAGKATTQKIKGGNTEEFYAHEGTMPKSKMLEDMHPDVAKVVWKFSRWHHQVDYSGFKQKLRYRDGELEKLKQSSVVNNYGMIIIPTNEEKNVETKTYIEEKYLGGK